MTDKEKAIEALRELCKSSHCVSESLRLSLKPFEVTERKNIIYDYINQPTLDDAIAVVEDIKHDMAKTYSIVCETEVQKAIAKTVDNVLEDILTALRGLKEGK